jgi:AcrR family transcriptional regulator
VKTTKKELLLEAAKELFAEYGYTETTFKKISEKAGVALGLLTHHYGNKEKLFLAAGLDVLDDLHRRLQEEMGKASTGLDAVRNYARCYFDFAMDTETNFLVLIRCSPFSDLKASEDRDIMVRTFAVLYDDLESCISRGIADGSIRQGCLPEKRLWPSSAIWSAAFGTCCSLPTASLPPGRMSRNSSSAALRRDRLGTNDQEKKSEQPFGLLRLFFVAKVCSSCNPITIASWILCCAGPVWPCLEPPCSAALQTGE